MKNQVDKKWTTLKTSVQLYNQSVKPTSLPIKIDPRKDALNTSGAFWSQVEVEFDHLHHEDPTKFKILESWGMIKCVHEERKILLRNMNNMIEFYRNKARIIGSMIRDTVGSVGKSQKLMPLLACHYALFSSRVSELEFRFKPFLTSSTDSDIVRTVEDEQNEDNYDLSDCTDSDVESLAEFSESEYPNDEFETTDDEL